LEVPAVGVVAVWVVVRKMWEDGWIDGQMPKADAGGWFHRID
jgi:hypothetical protein